MTRLSWVGRLAGLSRSAVVAFAIAALFGVIALRGTGVALSGAEVSAPARLSLASEKTLPKRADIFDRNGELLATSVAIYSLYADPTAIWDAGETVTALAGIFTDMGAKTQKTLRARLSDRDKEFVWLRRGLTPRQRQAVFDLGLEGLGFRVESQRLYPRGSQAGHVLGHTDIDGRGQMGLEFGLNDMLAGEEEPVHLTLDSGVQFALELELAEAAERHDVIGAVGIVLHAASGEVRALASWPAFNPNRPGDASDEERLNRAVGGVYELGSVFKPLTVAAALEAGVLDLNERFDVRAPIVLPGKTITDIHRASVPQMNAALILAESSNIGTVHIAQRLGDIGLQGFYNELGLLARAEVELPGSARPILPESWSELSIATASYGHGLAVSPLGFATAFASIANGGVRVEPRIVASDEPAKSHRVMSDTTASVLVDMLRLAVTDGTGRRGDAPGYRVAGKTGTAEKPVAGGYAADRNVTSFAALFPANSPEYVVLITLDDPRQLEGDGGATAAWNAAPVAGRVIERIAPQLGVLPVVDQAALASASNNGSAP